MEYSEARLADRLVMLAIAHRISNDSGEAWPSISTIARETKLSKRSVQYSIRNLEKTGELEVVTGDESRRENKYRMPKFVVWVQSLHPQGCKVRQGGGAKYDQKPNRILIEPSLKAEGAAAAWKAIGTDRLGTPKFRVQWEFFFAHRNGNTLSDAMERCIQQCQSSTITVPKPFYDAKRAVEAVEKANAPSGNNGKGAGLPYLPPIAPLPCRN
ncbi:MAG: helix-turn-helix domain-containing protein [Candidatus Acidiferrales bacterium]